VGCERQFVTYSSTWNGTKRADGIGAGQVKRSKKQPQEGCSRVQTLVPASVGELHHVTVHRPQLALAARWTLPFGSFTFTSHRHSGRLPNHVSPRSKVSSIAGDTHAPESNETLTPQRLHIARPPAHVPQQRIASAAHSIHQHRRLSRLPRCASK
jgi:hypothetical protein